MQIRRIRPALILLLMLPLWLANQKCDRSTTFGKETMYAEWESDHRDIEEDSTCSDCHDGRTPKSKPKSHLKMDWTRKHGKYANMKYGFNNDNVCYLCHTESECSKCHMQQAPLNHTEFWKRRGHGAFVGIDRSACMACHKSPDFCERCHSSSKPSSHDATWAGTVNRHCQNCHLPITSSSAQNCYVCHKETPSHPW